MSEASLPYSMEPQQVAVVGTFDVQNYGDLIFPFIVASRLGLESSRSLTCISPTRSRGIGGRHCSTISFLDAAGRKAHFDLTIIGGGNIIHCRESRVEPYFSAGTRCRSLAYPGLWVGPGSMPQLFPRVVWNAPGVPGEFDEHEYRLVKLGVERVEYLSLRDAQSAELLRPYVPNVELNITPDSAWDVDLIWNRGQLDSAFPKDLSVFTNGQQYAVFHVNDRYLFKQNLQSVARDIEQIASAAGCKIVLAPIGPCHNDIDVATKLSNRLRLPHYMVSNPTDVLQMTSILSSCSLYIGSSMHGAIVSASFCKPVAIVASQSRVKFEGLAQLFQRDDLVFEGWSSVKNCIEGNRLLKWSTQSTATRLLTRNALNDHWRQIGQIYAGARAAGVYNRDQTALEFSQFEATVQQSHRARKRYNARTKTNGVFRWLKRNLRR